MDLSYWERNTWFNQIDILIAGSGIVGLSAALFIKARKPNLNVLVVDRGFLPYGASTRNAGFACFGSISELTDDLQKMGEAKVFDLLLRRWNGLKKLRSHLGDDCIEYENLGGYEVFTDKDEAAFQNCVKQMDYFNTKLSALIGEEDIYIKADEKIAGFGLGTVNHLLLNRLEGQIDTGKMMSSLLEKVRSEGVVVLNGIEIKDFREEQDHLSIETTSGFSFHTKKMLITTNGFARQLIPELTVEPARAQVLITSPIDNLKVKGCFHYEKGFFYFRNVGNRILLGGGRNLAFKQEHTWEFGLTAIIQNKLNELLAEMILPGIDFNVEMRWSGIMGLGNEKTTIIKPITRNIYCAVRMGGMGIAIGSLVGDEAAEMICN